MVPASKKWLVGMALAMAGSLLVLIFVSSGRGGRAVELEGTGTQLDFTAFQSMCDNSCRHHEGEHCTGQQLSSYWIDYINSCDNNKENCHIPTMNCGGAWRFEDVN
uniref:Uncharacterized protein n=1 Tax=Hemiselmis andersenii TaxID=464988 RepID=A0A6U5CX36_HEMAN|mmetsp:Transcript_9647/g.23579  ORF Transcript_9647/g.23579 Transcript_9647/m.23579 type:complete len:106 (+) Transcript_9647:24-341(+)